MADGSLLFDTHIDGSGFEDGVNKLGGSAKKGLSAVSKIITAVIGSAVIKTGAECVNLASDLEEVQNVVDVTFGKSSGTINDWSRQAATAFGMSELSAKQYTGTLGAMLKSSGIADDAIVQMSTDLVGLSGDFASFFNLANEDAFAKIRSGISGETEPLKQLGINMSVANLEAYALSQGIKKSYSAMTQAEQVTLRYNYLMSVSADAQGDFARTSGSLANQQRITSLAIQNVGTEIGNMLIPYVTKATSAVGKFANGLAGALDERGIRGAITYIRTEFPLATAAVTGLATAYGALLVIKTVQKAVNTFQKSQVQLALAMMGTSEAALLESGALTAKEIIVGVLTKKISLATAAQALWNKVMLASPVMIAATAIGALIGGVVLLDSSLRKTNPELYEASDAMLACREESDRLADSMRDTAESIANTGDELSAQEDSALHLANALMNMSSAYSGTQGEQLRMQAICDKLNNSIDGLNVSFDVQTGAVNMSADAIRSWIKDYAKAQKMQSLAESYASAIETQASAEKNLKNAQEARMMAYDRLTPKEREIMQQYQNGTNITRELATSYAVILEKLRPYEDAVLQASEVMRQADEQVQQLNADIGVLGGSAQGSAQSVGDSIAQIEETIQNLKTVIEENQIAMDEIWNGYYESAKKNLDGVTGLFNTLGEESITSFDEMNAAIDSQLAWQQRYSDNLANLQSRNIDGIGEFASKFSDGTTQSANYLASFANLSDEQLKIVMEKMGEVSDNTDTIASAIADMNSACDPEWQRFKQAAEEAIESLNQAEAARANAYSTGIAAASGLNSAFPAYKNAVDRYNSMSIGAKVGGMISGSHAGGLSYVPYDGYIAELHKGERVLTAAEAAAYNNLAKSIDRPTDRVSIMQQSSSAAATADYSGIVTLLQKYLPKIGTGGVYLDKHTLIGEMAPEMNDEFGRIAALQERSTANA